MNFVVLGAGAIGCYLAGRLAAGGRRVALVGRPRTIDTLAASGLEVSDLEGFKVHVAARQLNLASSLAAIHMPPPSVLLVCVNGAATESAALEISACCPSGTTVVSLQNGIDNVARISAIAPRALALAAMVSFHVLMRTTSHVHRASAGKLHIASNGVSHEMALLLNACGLATELVRDLRPLQWGKLLLNLSNPVNALAELPLRAQLLDRDYRHALAGLQQEALTVMRRAGIRPARLTVAPPQALPHILRLPNGLFKLLAARMLRADASERTAMWNELPQARATDLDELCAAVVQLAAQNGLQAPRSTAMCKLIAAHRKGLSSGGQELRRTALP
ncbi:MAG: 2-dehydropantoate 2-reductase [Burkholderiaceae bacterium]